MSFYGVSKFKPLLDRRELNYCNYSCSIGSGSNDLLSHFTQERKICFLFILCFKFDQTDGEKKNEYIFLS